jgi:exodeoxyribonuclease VII large subunit
VAVVSSVNAAGYQDFMNELASGGYYFAVTLFDAVMQGHTAEESIIAALERVGKNMEQYDAVAIIRGGGSQSDLAAFDSYRLANHIAQFPLTVVAGIGHDKDQSVADLVAGVSLKTPTAVAAWLVAGLSEFDAWLDELHGDVVQIAVDYLDTQKHLMQSAAMTLAQTASGLTRTIEVRLERLAGELMRRREGMVMKLRNRLDMLHASLKERATAGLTREASRLELATQMTASRKPDAILSLGFAIVRRDGIAVKDATALRTGDHLDVTFAQGSAKVIISD